MSEFRIIFVHGYTASSKLDWYPDISPLLDKLGIDYVIPDLPGGRKPLAQEWVKIVRQKVDNTDKPVILVGHSLGTRAVLLYLDQYGEDRWFEKVILIAPLSNEVKNAQRRKGEAYPDFFEYKIDLEKAKMKVGKFVVVHSKNDHSLDYDEHGVALSEELGAKLIAFEDRDHFSQPESAAYILKILKDELGV